MSVPGACPVARGPRPENPCEEVFVVQDLAGLLPLVAIGLLFWLLLIRPASRRQKEVRVMQSALNVGDEVMLTSGIYGTVRSLEDDRVHLEIAAGVVVEAARGAVGQRLAPREASPTAEGSESDVSADEAAPTDTTDNPTGER
jgi:preprotein translocase subunit YajC